MAKRKNVLPPNNVLACFTVKHLPFGQVFSRDLIVMSSCHPDELLFGLRRSICSFSDTDLMMIIIIVLFLFILLLFLLIFIIMVMIALSSVFSHSHPFPQNLLMLTKKEIFKLGDAKKLITSVSV